MKKDRKANGAMARTNVDKMDTYTEKDIDMKGGAEK